MKQSTLPSNPGDCNLCYMITSQDSLSGRMEDADTRYTSPSTTGYVSLDLSAGDMAGASTASEPLMLYDFIKNIGTGKIRWQTTSSEAKRIA